MPGMLSPRGAHQRARGHEQYSIVFARIHARQYISIHCNCAAPAAAAAAHSVLFGGKYYIAAVKVPRSGVYTGIVEQHKEKLAAEGAKIARDYQIIILNCAPRIEQVAF